MATRPSRGGTVDRRSFLTLAAAGVAAPAVLGACGGSPGGGAVTDGAALKDVEAILPRYVPVEYAKPDIPGVNGTPPGYVRPPAALVTAYPTPPGTGRTITAMGPVWTPVRDASGSRYRGAVNAAIGSNLDVRAAEGSSYSEKLSVMFASTTDIPDWIDVPDYMRPKRFEEAAVALFHDLTPFLSGEAVTKYKHLANLPTGAWRVAIFNGRILGIPFVFTPVNAVGFYRNDLLSQKGITALPTSAAEMLTFAKELTGGDQWAFDDPGSFRDLFFARGPDWYLVDGKLLHKLETPEYRESLEWAATLFRQGSVHPAAVAGDNGGAKSRFEAGQVFMKADGITWWLELLRRKRPADPTFSMLPLPPISHSGGTPLLWKEKPASGFSFIKKTDDTGKVEEILRIADFLAAPIGTTEYQLLRSGVDGLHYTTDPATRAITPTPLGVQEVDDPYPPLAFAPPACIEFAYPDYVEQYCGWMADASKYVKEPLFYGLPITQPYTFSRLVQAVYDLESDYFRGRKTPAELDAALADFRKNGVEEMRGYYSKFV
ncbi:extracellular solute-binding protein [Actinomycetes bacterium KLBMP 9759]